MDDHLLEIIDLELAVLTRRLISITTYKKIGNLDRSAYLLLNQLTMHGSAGVKALADELHLDISTVSRQASTLEQKGYVNRVPDPLDGRAYFLQITDLGAKAFNDDKTTRLAKVKEHLNGWPDDERKVFGQLLKKFNHSFVLNNKS